MLREGHDIDKYVIYKHQTYFLRIGAKIVFMSSWNVAKAFIKPKGVILNSH
jgi:hypothetical protein